MNEVPDTDLSVPEAMQIIFSGRILSPAAVKTRKLELTGILDSTLLERTEKNAN